MSTFVGTSIFFRSTLCAAMETMRFHIAQMDYYLGQYLPHVGIPPKQFDTH